MRNMYGLEGSERSLIDGDATETATMAGSAATPSARIAQSPTEDMSPVAPPASAPTAEHISPVSAPASAPTMEEQSPVFESPISAPASAPTMEDLPPVSAPATFPYPTFPTPFDDSTTPLTPSSSSMAEDIESWLLNPIHLIVIACIAGAVLLLLFWKCCKSWKLKREKQMLRLQSTRVDAVLGDMQMVGMEEYDSDDPELI